MEARLGGDGTGTWGTQKVRRRETDTRLAQQKRTENKLRTSVCYRDADFWVSTNGSVGRRRNTHFYRVLVVARHERANVAFVRVVPAVQPAVELARTSRRREKCVVQGSWHIKLTLIRGGSRHICHLGGERSNLGGVCAQLSISGVGCGVGAGG